MYYIVYGLLWLISLLPMRVLYFISDLLYGLIFYIFKYRRDVVMKNLSIAFPGKSEKEKLIIAKKFYHNLVDTFIETIKMISASYAFIEKRFTANVELINDYYESGRSVQIHLGHNFNWEWGNSLLATKTPFKLLVVYMPITNKVLEKLFYKLRSRTGTVLLRATNMKEDFIPYRSTQYLLGLAADQNPGHPMSAWWFNFFDRPTPFVKGPARAAIANDTVVLFAFIHKPKRGHYKTVLSLMTEEPQKFTETELTQQFVHQLENVIKEYPEMWLWSHRRWKWEWKPEYGPVND
jgi:KDO2-lipid IV(A) lauroyltransferase